MYPLVKAEMYKFKKANIYKYSLVSSILPILFFIYILQGKLVLIEKGYSMNQWCAVLLFQLSEQFLIPTILLVMMYELVFKEKDIGYRDMLIVRKNSKKILLAKLIPSIIYSIIIILITIIVIISSYGLAAPYTSYFTGKVINSHISSELAAFQLNIMFLITYGVFLPTISLVISSFTSTKGTFFQLITGLFIGRMLSAIGVFNTYTVWFYLKQAKYIIKLNGLELIWRPYIGMIMVLVVTILFNVIRVRINKFKLKGGKND